MDLINATAETLKQEFDSVEYVFPAGEVVTVPEDAGKHILSKLGYTGLQPILWNSSQVELRRIAVEARLKFHRFQVAVHERANRVQKERNFPPLEDPEGVIQARIYIPQYEAALEEIRKLQAETDAEVLASQAKEALSKPLPMPPSLAELPIEELRKIAKDCGITVDRKWDRRTLMKLIFDARGKPEEPRRPRPVEPPEALGPEQ